MMSPAALVDVAQQLDVHRRVAEAQQALLLQRIDAVGAHVVDGFRQVAGWGRAACNWSGAEADRLFTEQATALPFDDLVTFLQHWLELADAEGARSKHDRATQQRRVHARGVRPLQ
jgi:hypothetical protein